MFSSAVKPRQHRPAGDAQLVGNILHRAILDVVRHQHAAVVLADEGQLPTEGVQPLGVCAVVLVHNPRLSGQLISGYELTAFVLGLCPTAVPIAGDAPDPTREIRGNRPLTQGGHDLAGDLGGQILGLGGVAALAQAEVEHLLHVVGGILLHEGFRGGIHDGLLSRNGYLGGGAFALHSYSVGNADMIAVSEKKNLPQPKVGVKAS